MPRNRASLHMDQEPEHCPLWLQTEQFHVIIHKLFQVFLPLATHFSLATSIFLQVDTQSSPLFAPYAQTISICQASPFSATVWISKRLYKTSLCFLSFKDTPHICAYTTYVRPVLEYCTQIWSPTLIKYIDLFENVQRSFTRSIPVLKNLSYPERLANLDIETLELRRLRFDLLMYFKIIWGFVRIQCDDFLKFSINPYPTRGNHFKLVMPIVRNNNLSNMFACRCVGIWNSLPDEVVNSLSNIHWKKLF